jgi:hypothetical protein
MTPSRFSMEVLVMALSLHLEEMVTTQLLWPWIAALSLGFPCAHTLVTAFLFISCWNPGVDLPLHHRKDILELK